ncbi:hypothetical protein FH972_021092 [Carpinus fangiana]|uniref:Uncharacterized protein n=1 Tax=Carpinus fangiana TaxID=176857 RepID=A0A5N6KNQ6_9ROSI|nr:hypothetical protein FH972_021092 [Carpinus fangiana]
MYYVVKEVDGGEDPPGISEERFVRTGISEEVVYVVEICKIGVDFEYPVGLDENDGANVEERPAARGVEEYGCAGLETRRDWIGSERVRTGNRQVPAICWGVREDEGAVKHAEDKLQGWWSDWNSACTRLGNEPL